MYPVQSRVDRMKLSDTLAYCLYPVYNFLAIHNAPLCILDLFLPILITAKWKETLIKELENVKIYTSVDDLINDLHKSRENKKGEYRNNIL